MTAWFIAVAMAALVAADPALAQALGGTTPATFGEAMRSALGHPVTGLAHVAAVVAVGCLAATQANGPYLVGGYVLASVVGASAHVGEATVANATVFVALAAVALGLLVFRREPLRRDIVFALFGGTGLINGYVLGAPIAAAQRDLIAAYLAGMAVIQVSLAMAVMFGLRALATRAALQLFAMRVIGAFTVGAGAAILLQRYGAGA